MSFTIDKKLGRNIKRYNVYTKEELDSIFGGNIVNAGEAIGLQAQLQEELDNVSGDINNSIIDAFTEAGFYYDDQINQINQTITDALNGKVAFDTSYNEVVINENNGIIVTGYNKNTTPDTPITRINLRGDGVTEDGISVSGIFIQKNEGTTIAPDWVTNFWASDGGDLYLNGNLQLSDGSVLVGTREDPVVFISQEASFSGISVTGNTSRTVIGEGSDDNDTTFSGISIQALEDGNWVSNFYANSDGDVFLRGQINAVSGFLGSLVVEGMLSSSNYVEGVSGFAIDGDTGDAEFNDVAIRTSGSSIGGGASLGDLRITGTLEIGNPKTVVISQTEVSPAVTYDTGSGTVDYDSESNLSAKIEYQVSRDSDATPAISVNNNKSYHISFNHTNPSDVGWGVNNDNVGEIRYTLSGKSSSSTSFTPLETLIFNSTNQPDIGSSTFTGNTGIYDELQLSISIVASSSQLQADVDNFSTFTISAIDIRVYISNTTISLRQDGLYQRGANGIEIPIGESGSMASSGGGGTTSWESVLNKPFDGNNNLDVGIEGSATGEILFNSESSGLARLRMKGFSLSDNAQIYTTSSSDQTLEFLNTGSGDLNMFLDGRMTVTGDGNSGNWKTAYDRSPIDFTFSGGTLSIDRQNSSTLAQSIDGRYLRLIGGTLTGDLTVQGNITQNGEHYITHAEHLDVENNLITVNHGEAGSGITAGFGGMKVDRGTANDYLFGFSETPGFFQVGKEGDLQTVATRENSPTAAGIPFWNSTANRFDTGVATLDSAGNLSALGGIFSDLLRANTLRTDTGKILSPTDFAFRNAGDTDYRKITAKAIDIDGNAFVDSSRNVSANEGDFNSLIIRDESESIEWEIGTGSNERLVIFTHERNVPFMIFNGAPTNTLRITASGDIQNFSGGYQIGSTTVINSLTDSFFRNGEYSGILDVEGRVKVGDLLYINPDANRFEVHDQIGEKAVMGYLSGIPKNDGSGNWGSNDYGFWVKEGDKMIIDGDLEYENGDWLIENDATLMIVDGITENRIIALGTQNGRKGLFLYDGAGDADGNVQVEMTLAGLKAVDGFDFQAGDDFWRTSDNSFRFGGIGGLQGQPGLVEIGTVFSFNNSLGQATLAGWTVDDEYLWTGTKQTIDGQYASSGITLYSGGAIRAENFRIDLNGNAYYRGAINALDGMIEGTLLMGANGEITNQNEDYSINNNGIYLKVTSEVGGATARKIVFQGGTDGDAEIFATTNGSIVHMDGGGNRLIQNTSGNLTATDYMLFVNGISSSDDIVLNGDLDMGGGVITALGGTSNQWNTAYDYRVTGVSGSGNGTLTISRGGASNVTTSLSHNHDSRYGRLSSSNNWNNTNNFHSNLMMRDGNTQHFYNSNSARIRINARGAGGAPSLYKYGEASNGTNVSYSEHWYNGSTYYEIYMFSNLLRMTSGLQVEGMSTSGSSANVYATSSGILYRSTSSRRYKKDIYDLSIAYNSLNTIGALRPVHFRNIDHDTKHIGLIAEEVDEIIPEVIHYDEQGNPDGIGYSHLTALLIDGVKDLNTTFTDFKQDQKTENELLKERVAALEQEVQTLQQQLN